jgi:hypothetical protein
MWHPCQLIHLLDCDCIDFVVEIAAMTTCRGGMRNKKPVLCYTKKIHVSISVFRLTMAYKPWTKERRKNSGDTESIRRRTSPNEEGVSPPNQSYHGG